MFTVEFFNKELVLRNGEKEIIISLEEQSLLLERANQQLESDISSCIDYVSDHKFGHLSWAVTWKELRYDDLEGLILYYYILELISYSVKKFKFEKVVIKGNFPSYFAKYIREACPQKLIFILKEPSFQSRIKESLAPLKLYRAAFKSILGKRPVIKKDGIWLSAGIDIRRNRYRHVLDFIDAKERFFYNNSHIISIKTEEFGSPLNFSIGYSLGDFSRSLFNALTVKRSINKIKSHGFVSGFIKSMPVMHIAGMRVREIWVERALIKYKPKAVFFTTANTYPPARLISRLAKIHNIPFIVVACRSMFTRLRPEERAFKADFAEVNNARVADYHIVWDQFSVNTLTSVGFDREKIFLAQNAQVAPFYSINVKDSWLLLLTHEKAMNDKMIEALRAAMASNKLNVAYRTHPLQPLTVGQLEKLNEICNSLTDCSGVPMNKIFFDSTVALTINSTAAVEAVSYGCGVLWMPYLNYRSVIFYTVMSVLGKVANQDSDLKNSVDALQAKDERQKFVSNCLKSYKIYFLGESNVNKLFQKLNIS